MSESHVAYVPTMLVLFILTYNFRTEYHRKCHSHFLLSVLSLRVPPQPKVNSVTKKFITRVLLPVSTSPDHRFLGGVGAGAGAGCPGKPQGSP